MKRSEMVLKMARAHTTKYCMVEEHYITKLDFYSEMLELMESLGMLPPPNDTEGPPGLLSFGKNKWESE